MTGIGPGLGWPAHEGGTALVQDRHLVSDDGTKKREQVPSANYGVGKKWRARYVDDHGNEHAKGFDRKTDAQSWLNAQMSTLVQGTHVSPRDAQLTVQEWCDLWIKGYGVHRDSTVRQARVHIKLITHEFGEVPLAAVRPSSVKSWVAKLKGDGREPSYDYALHTRLSQIMGDAVHEVCWSATRAHAEPLPRRASRSRM
ncbi:hypothetical protein [Nocardia asteroides]|uniref:hypothetical protein n=1 Tax=Nocardia asteroides TaxID=1824 RepID=UPI003657304E